MHKDREKENNITTTNIERTQTKKCKKIQAFNYTETQIYISIYIYIYIYINIYI